MVVKGDNIRIVHPKYAMAQSEALVVSVEKDGITAVITLTHPNSGKVVGDMVKLTKGYVKIPAMDEVWDFVERYYNGYHQSNEVALSDDLQKLVDNEFEEGDCAWDLLQSEYGGDYEGSLERIKLDLMLVDHSIYLGAIGNFLSNS